MAWPMVIWFLGSWELSLRGTYEQCFWRPNAMEITLGLLVRVLTNKVPHRHKANP